MTPDEPTTPAYDAPPAAPEPVDLPETAGEQPTAPTAQDLPATELPSAAAPVDEPVEVTTFAEPPAEEEAPEPVAEAVAEEAPEPVVEPVFVAPGEPTAVPVAVPDVPAADLPLADPTEAAEEPPAYAVEGDRPVRRGPLVPVLAGLVVVLAGLTGFLGWEAHRTAGPAPVVATRDDAVASAREAARLVFSYDYRHLQKDFAAGKAVTTGDFSKEYDRTTSKLSDDFAPRYKAVVSADVSASSVVRESGDEVVCLVFVNQVSTSTLVTTPKVTQSRLEMTMRRGDDGRWRVAKIDAL